MPQESLAPREGYQPPDPIEVPPLYAWPPLFRAAHELHHRNANTGPWTGISMHPLEHVVYFTLFLLWWVVPVHPVIIILTGFYQGISPSISHSGFDQIALKGVKKISAGDQFHHLHHRYFHVNFGNTPTPWTSCSAAGTTAPSRRTPHSGTCFVPGMPKAGRIRAADSVNGVDLLLYSQFSIPLKQGLS